MPHHPPTPPVDPAGAPNVVDLRVERLVNPLGVGEARPLFGWRLEAAGRDRRQTAYRIRVTTDDAALAVWDSGLVRSSRCHDVRYDGPPLRSRTRYQWSVRVWDESARSSPWSAPATFETALADDQWHAAAWIGSSIERDARRLPSLDPTSQFGDICRVWAPDVDGAVPRAAVFGTVVSLPDEPVAGAGAVVVGAGHAELWVNDTLVDLDAGGVVDGALVAALVPGPNRIVVSAATDLGGPPGVLARVDVRLRSGATMSVGTDGRWRCGDTPAAVSAPTSALAVEVGAHGDPPWGREVITHRPSPYLRREIDLPAPVRRARARSTALGAYELRINGRRVGESRLSPGWTDFATRVAYQTHDVTDLFQPGANAVGAVLADGWYAGHLADWGPFQYGDQRLFRMRIDLELEDGSRVVVVTDRDWRVGDGATRYADLQNGEVVDLRLEPTRWDCPGFDDTDWAAALVAEPSHGRLEPESAPPIVATQEIPAETVVTRADGAHVVDFGQNVVGWVRLRLAGAAGTRVLVRHAEVLDAGPGSGLTTSGERPFLYTESLRHARCTDEYILAGDPDGELAEPRFTVHGFRYCEVIGYDRPLAPGDITAVVAHADLEPTGTFECSDARLNRLHANIGWSQRGNFLAVPTDCPQRDERMGWTGDAQAFASTAAFGYDVRGFLRKWLQDVRDAQFADGSVPHVAPDLFTKAGVARGDAGGAAGWGDAIVVVPAELARLYGDDRVVEENLEAIGAWLEFCRGSSAGGIRPDSGFGDWLAVTHTPRDLVATAFFAHSARLAAGLAARVERPDLVARWSALHAEVRAAFRARWVRGGGVIVPGTQAAYVLALHFGLFDDAERDRAAARLAAEVRARHDHLTTGFLATPYLLPVLSSHGYEDIAFRLLGQESYPSWLYPVVHGSATTIWERWDSWSDSRGFQDPSMTSFNHYAYGAVGEWMYRTLGGIEILEDGPHTLRVRPRPGGGVTWARATLRTVMGDVSSEWRVGEGRFELRVGVPVGATADVRLPTSRLDDVRESGAVVAATATAAAADVGAEVSVIVGSGRYEFTAPCG